MSESICRDLRAGGHERDWDDIPCGEPATTTYAGRPVCQEHRESAERRERETIAETFFDGVNIERIRAISKAGELETLLATFDVLRSLLEEYRSPRWTNTLHERGTRALAVSEAFQLKGKP